MLLEPRDSGGMPECDLIERYRDLCRIERAAYASAFTVRLERLLLLEVLIENGWTEELGAPLSELIAEARRLDDLCRPLAARAWGHVLSGGSLQGLQTILESEMELSSSCVPTIEELQVLMSVWSAV